MDTAYTAYTVDQIRRAEQPLLDAETTPDELMRSAAGAVAEAARTMLERRPVMPERYRRVLLAVGSGGNGGDALYAGAELAEDGWEVDAVLLGRGGTAHERALAAFTSAGGRVVGLDDVRDTLPRYRLVVDGILGMGGSGGLSAAAATLFSYARQWVIPVLAVDVPSGIDADTGAVPAPVISGSTGSTGDTAHVTADVTVTFGGLRRAHALNAYCGQVVVADPGLAGGDGRTISAHLPPVGDEATRVQTAVAYRPATGRYDFDDTSLRPIRRVRSGGPREPGPYDDKYSGGVVGICAGSATYPGAGVLATTAAVRTTSSMVRYIGDGGSDVVRACPEVVASRTVPETGRVQAWVVGPGRGTGEDAALELEELLGRPEPLVIDADAITLLAQHRELRDALISRSDGSRDAPTALLTPHDGEFRRLAGAVDGVVPDPADDRLGAVVAMADHLHCGVLLKGRHTVLVERPLADGDGRRADTIVHTVDAGTSWGATPGSGDVLAGMLGAAMAESQATLGTADHVAAGIVALHGAAVGLSARVGDAGSGHAPTSASRIAEAIPSAWAATASS